jgi:hypothetical protein
VDTDTEVLLDTESDDDELPADELVEDEDVRLLYICRREEPPQYSNALPMHVKLQVLPVVETTLPAAGEFPQ